MTRRKPSHSHEALSQFSREECPRRPGQQPFEEDLWRTSPVAFERQWRRDYQSGVHGPRVALCADGHSEAEAVRAAISEFGTVDGGPVLRLILRVRLAGVAAVADRPDPLPDASGIPDTYADAPGWRCAIITYRPAPMSITTSCRREVGASDRLVWDGSQ